MSKPKSQLYFFGHNCFLIEARETFILIDPWLSKEGAFFGSWFQYPKNHHLQRTLIDLTHKKRGYVFYSHEHQDHFDLNTFLQFSSDTEIIIPNFKDKYLKNTFLRNNFNCIELDDNIEFHIKCGVSLKILISDIGVNHDSAVLIKTEDFVFLNQNDCKIFDRLSNITEKITYYSVQFSGATWHPVCFNNYTDQEKIIISKNKSLNKLKNVLNAIRKIKPEYFIPAAGPAIFPFLDISLSLGTENIFIHQDALNSFLLENKVSNVLYPLPGDIVDSNLLGKPPMLPPSLAEIENYKIGLNDFWKTYDPTFNLNDLKKAILERLEKIKDLYFECDVLIKFIWGNSPGEMIVIDLNNKIIVDNKSSISGKTFTLNAEKKYFSLMSTKERWQDIYLSMRATIYREPDHFNNFVNLFLFSDVDNIRNAFIYTISIMDNQIKIVKKGSDGSNYKLNRFCPHQGADLVDAEINVNNELICPRHGWKFSLNHSGCTHDRQFSVCSEKIK